MLAYVRKRMDRGGRRAVPRLGPVVFQRWCFDAGAQGLKVQARHSSASKRGLLDGWRKARRSPTKRTRIWDQGPCNTHREQ